MSHRKSLPSLGALVTFQVAARHLSFTRAGDELNVTQAAISQQIRLLEKGLGKPLFVRLRNGLALTAEGAALLGAVRQGIGTIASAVETLRDDSRDASSVTISATAGVAQFFVWPLVRAYRRSHPGVHFALLASDEDPSLHALEEVDLAIVCGIERFKAGDELSFLFNEVVEPVCSPGYRDRHGPFDTAEAIAEADLLDLHDRHWQGGNIGWQPLGWADWFAARGLDRPRRAAFCTTSYAVLVDAARSSAGVMLGWRHMLQPCLEAGELVVANPACLERERGSFLKLDRDRIGHNPHAVAFAEVIMAAARRLRAAGNAGTAP